MSEVERIVEIALKRHAEGVAFGQKMLISKIEDLGYTHPEGGIFIPAEVWNKIKREDAND